MIARAWRLVPAVALVVLTSCGSEDRSAAVEEREMGLNVSPEVDQQLAQLQSLIAPFQDFESAQAAGWSMTLTECLENPGGAMGHHLGNGAFIDAQSVLLEPQLLVYEPQNGRFRLVAVEYIVPFSMVSANADPPVLLGQQFHQNLVYGVWALGVRIGRHDPDGRFEDRIPNVSCAYATATGELQPDELTALVNGACLRARAGLKGEAIQLLERALALPDRGYGRPPDP
jgi:hypothetical protein